MRESRGDFPLLPQRAYSHESKRTKDPQHAGWQGQAPRL